jgi:hypothetical protein
MEPKDKAIQLFNKFKLKEIKPIYMMHPQHSRQCALIAVDEILKTQRPDSNNYWQEVKNELEKL